MCRPVSAGGFALPGGFSLNWPGNLKAALAVFGGVEHHAPALPLDLLEQFPLISGQRSTHQRDRLGLARWLDRRGDLNSPIPMKPCD
jgi:hypothetical protein